ncbi:MAG: hypothetical protein AAF389_17955 [Gemmatimonadota bacterium]
MMSADGRRLYFISNRPRDPEATEPADFDIWYVERDGDGWGPEINVGAPVNSPGNEYFVSLTDDGDVFFASDRAEPDGGFRALDIYEAKWNEVGYQEPVRLDHAVNSPYYDADPFISRDGRTLIFASVRPGGLGRGDLYVSRRGEDGVWSGAESAGSAINTAGHELCPTLTPDGRFLLYTGEQEIRWISMDAVGRGPGI